MLNKKNVQEIKSTILGIILILGSLYYVFFFEDVNIWIFGILLGVGISLLFIADDFLKAFKEQLRKKGKEL